MSKHAAKKADSSAGWFSRFAARAAKVVGSPAAFLVAICSIVVWLAAGPAFGWSNTWQLVINSITNLVTYVVVFVIQNSQNRDSEAINLKLNELIAATAGASNDLINVEQLSDKALDSLFERYEAIRKERSRRKQ